MNEKDMQDNKTQIRDFITFILEDDEEFYEHYLSNLTEEEYELFLKENPEFQTRRR